MFTVIKLGGVNGSGKTTIAREVMKLAGTDAAHTVLESGKETTVHLGQYLGVPIIVLGKYKAACGGMDTISDKHDRLLLLQRSCMAGRIVFYEGLITGKTYGAMGAMSEDHVNNERGRWLYTFMDTPFDVAVERVLARRAEAGNDAPFDPERTMRSTYTSCVRLESYLRGTEKGRNEVMQHPVHSINHTKKPKAEAKKLLDKALELHHAGF